MKRSLTIFLAAGALAVQAGTITSAGLIADRSGTRVVLQSSEEPLSRSTLDPDGALRIEVQGCRTTLGGTHKLANNPLFTAVEASNSERAGIAFAIFRFTPRDGAQKASVKHREWDGAGLSFLIEKEAAKVAVADFWSVPFVSVQTNQPVFASLSVTPALQSVKAWGNGDFETVVFDFPTPTLKAELVGSGKKFSIRLGKARLAGKLSPPPAASKLIQSIAVGKDASGDLVVVTLKKEPRSLLVARSGSSVVLRMVLVDANRDAWNWNSKSGKLDTYNSSTPPSDETADASSLRKGLATTSGTGFSVEGSPSPTAARGVLSAGTASIEDAAGLSEAQKLETERRKSREFTDRKVAENVAQQEAVDKQNRVIYNTFGIRDPFIPLEPDDIESGLNIDQMKVVGIIASPTRPMAVLEHTSQPGLSVALKEGDAIQNGRVLKIERDRVVFLLEEFGVSRQFALKLQAPKGDKS
jgi:hypothetical protein